jgi:deoxyribonuclease IV
MNIGAHVSIAGGIFESPKRAADLGCEVMQIFTRSPQGGKAPELTPEIVEEFKLNAKNFQIKATYVHTPYYINFASAKSRIRYGSVSILRQELERASLIGAKFVMTHLGTAKELGQEEASQKNRGDAPKSFGWICGFNQVAFGKQRGSGRDHWR